MHHAQRYRKLDATYRQFEALPGSFRPSLGAHCGGCDQPIDLDGDDPDSAAFGWRAATGDRKSDFILCAVCAGDAVPDRLPTLAEARRIKGISQAGLARTAGISHGAVSYYESGDRSPGIHTAIKLAHALGTRPDLIAWPGGENA